MEGSAPGPRGLPPPGVGVFVSRKWSISLVTASSRAFNTVLRSFSNVNVTPMIKMIEMSVATTTRIAPSSKSDPSTVSVSRMAAIGVEMISGIAIRKSETNVNRNSVTTISSTIAVVYTITLLIELMAPRLLRSSAAREPRRRARTAAERDTGDAAGGRGSREWR